MCVVKQYVIFFVGYGFVDFDSPVSAQKAVAALKTIGVQAQMAKVSQPNMTSLPFFLISPFFLSSFSLIQPRTPHLLRKYASTILQWPSAEHFCLHLQFLICPLFLHSSCQHITLPLPSYACVRVCTVSTRLTLVCFGMLTSFPGPSPFFADTCRIDSRNLNVRFWMCPSTFVLLV